MNGQVSARMVRPTAAKARRKIWPRPDAVRASVMYPARNEPEKFPVDAPSRSRHERRARRRSAPRPPKQLPDHRRQTKGKVIVEKSHLERPAEGEHGEAGMRNHGAWRVAAATSENAPQKKMRAESTTPILSAACSQKCFPGDLRYVEENVVPLFGDPESAPYLVRSIVRARVIHMTIEVAGDDVAMPKAGNQQEYGDEGSASQCRAHELKRDR